MNERVLRILEFDKIKHRLMQHASTTMGREKAEALKPSSHFEEVQTWQQATEEGRTVYRLKGLIPLGGIRDIREAVKRASIGASLNAKELLDIADTVMAGRRLKKFLFTIDEEYDQGVPILTGYAAMISDLKELEDEIRECIDQNGEIVDHASPDLRRIRSELRDAHARVKEKLESMIRSSFYQKMLQEPIITIRNDRYCIPVKAEYRGTFGGIVHDQSASGATLFIEPEEVVAINNRVQELEIKEQREIERILAKLSASVGKYTEELQAGLEALAEIDFIHAKAVLANEMRAAKPILNAQGKIRLKHARHPLLDPETAVPIDVRLGDDFSLLVITGPNTGGKTVTLKTVGLLTLMAMSGLQIPALDGSELSVFDKVFADIGDEQSIEQNLSTFSSHMTNIIDILEQVDFRSLVLFDELGAGTDPTEGAALAMAILDFLVSRGAKTIATTHYSELKAYAYNNEEAINASMEFDVESLRPTYRLLIGVPGRSNAFAISERLGLRQDVIERAKTKLNAEDVQVDDLIRQLEKNQLIAEKERREAERLRRELEEERAKFEAEREKFLQQRERIIELAEEKARTVISKAEREAAEILEELRRMRREAELSYKEHELIELKKKLENAAPTRRERRRLRKASAAKEIHPGDTVVVLTFNQKGTVLEVNERDVLVQIGAMKTKVKKDDLQPTDQPKQETRPVVTRSHQTAPTRVQMDLDLRGETVEEAILEIDKFLDNAVLHGFSEVSIIHGKGTGALRAGVQQFLRKHPQVKSFRPGVHGEGGTGVTIVTLK
ncbi:endonuclease MutS2 [Collibacillus ludicampi]|uniref:Endonuclease MutS2 n=1 Tax=Collibacillus ludicampi TaxID=2771369 RepID=A0AAV4LHK1_9BACL|nr:endonuclease MutS2 [Collibacillus ludicampi]GIM47179.1 endonuclease MutS2 [Collibacillus ludicampi]